MIYTSRKTLYQNTIFRSSLEAAWAAFFDSHNIKWLYEPQTFTDGGSWYLPDFFLENVRLRNDAGGVWLEIKPSQIVNGIDVLKQNESKFARMQCTGAFCVFFGSPTIAQESENHAGYQIYPWWDNYMTFQKCCECGAVKIEFDEGNYKVCPTCGAPTKSIVGYF